jgi:hypothetical protein
LPDVEPDHAKLFNPVALQNYRAGANAASEVLRAPRGWLNRVYWLLVVGFVTVLAFLTFGSMDEFAIGPCVVRAEGRRLITGGGPGVIRAIAINQGAHVEANQVLAEVESGPAGRAASHLIRAPESGRIADVRVHPGQVISGDEPLAALTPDSPRFRLMMALPGHYRPMLSPGMVGKLELEGFPYAYESVSLDSLSSDLLGAADLQRLLGTGDLKGVEGPAALGEASLSGSGFQADGRQYPYYDGMLGTVRVRVGRARLLGLMIPSLKTR